jgi:Na+/H+ antiporter NhaA
MQAATLILGGAVIVLIGGPLLVFALGFMHARRTLAAASTGLTSRCDWKLLLTSAVLYALAYNLIFFIQDVGMAMDSCSKYCCGPASRSTEGRSHWTSRTRHRTCAPL